MVNILVNAPRTANKGEVIELKALIQHPMETGFRPGPNGQIIPRNIIERFTATWNGTEVFCMDFSPAIAANPFVSFCVTARESGTVGLRWTGDDNFVAEKSVVIDVG